MDQPKLSGAQDMNGTSLADFENHMRDPSVDQAPPDNYGAILENIRRGQGQGQQAMNPMQAQFMQSGNMGGMGGMGGMGMGQTVVGQGMGMGPQVSTGPPFGFQSAVYPPAGGMADMSMFHPGYDQDDAGEYVDPPRPRKSKKAKAQAQARSAEAPKGLGSKLARFRPMILVALVVFAILAFVAPKLATTFPFTVDQYGKFSRLGLMLVSVVSGGVYLGASEAVAKFT